MDNTEKAELVHLFSKLSRQIHRLSPLEAQALLEVDMRMGRGVLGAEDLHRLREIEKAHP